MATISYYDSSSISVLFSSFNNNNNNRYSNYNFTSDMLGINYSDYATLRNGSYGKLLKAYYATENSDVSSLVNNSTTSKDSSKTLGLIESDADKLKEAADALLEKGRKSVFEKKSVTETDGTVSEKYDVDAIYSAVDKFVKNYNEVVDSTAESNTTSIANSSKRLLDLTTVNQRLLSKVGITVDEDLHLVVDEKKFKEADMGVVKSIFGSTGGYGYSASAQASMISYHAQYQASKSNTYGNNGGYTYNYSTGELYNTYI